MSKIVLNSTAGGYNLQNINANFDKIEDALNNDVLYRDNPVGEPNAMSSDLDMNSKRIYNLPEPIVLNEAARLQDVTNAIAGASNANLILASDSAGGTLWTTVQGFINKIISSTGATVIGATGGAYTTVQGFITYAQGQITSLQSQITNLTTSIGSSLIGFIQAGTGAILRTTQDKLRETVSVLDFGADSTGASNSTTAFANAIATGKTVYVPKGVYLCTSLSVTTAGQKIYGEGINASIIRSTDPTLNLFSITASNVTFSDIEVQGTATSATTSRFAFFTSSATPALGLKLIKVKCTGLTAGVGFTNFVKFDDNCHGGRVMDCYVDRLWGNASGFGYGVLVGNCRDVIVRDLEWYGSSGRGRHGIYFSSGANRCKAMDSHIEGADYENITLNSQGAQPADTDNIIAFNTLIGGCAAIPGITSGSISVFGHSSGNLIIGNKIRNSLGCGIKLEGTGVTDLNSTSIINNEIFGPATIGIDIVSGVSGMLHGNLIQDASQSSVGTYAAVRFVSDGTTSTSNWVCTGNRIPLSAVGRSGFQANANAPVPVSLKFTGNHVGTGTTTDYEFLGGTNFPVDGRLRFSQAYDPPSIANGASVVSNWSVNGAAVGDLVTVSHSSNTDGCIISGNVISSGSVDVTIGNLSGVAKDIVAGTILIDVWKRSP